MTSLKQEFIDSCPVEGGFRMRGLEMTRIEVFVDAAFAFAVTMLVIGIGFIALCLVFVLMYHYAGSLKKELLLDAFESYETRTLEYLWIGAAGVGAVSIILAVTLPLQFIPFSGFAFALLGVWFPFLRSRRARNIPGKG